MFENIPLTLAQEDVVVTQDDAAGAPAANEGTETTGQPGAPAGPDGTVPPLKPKSLFGDGMLPLLMMMVVIMIIFTMRGSRKEKKKRAAMIAALQKGDKVQTVGGIIGTVVQVRDSDLVLKVDENTGAKISFSRSAVQTVLDQKEE